MYPLLGEHLNISRHIQYTIFSYGVLLGAAPEFIIFCCSLKPALRPEYQIKTLGDGRRFGFFGGVKA